MINLNEIQRAIVRAYMPRFGFSVAPYLSGFIVRQNEREVAQTLFEDDALAIVARRISEIAD